MSDEFEDVCEGTYACTSTEDRSHTKLRREDFARSIPPWRRAPGQRQRSVRRYLYIYIRLRKKLKKIGQHTCTPPNSIQFRKFTKPPRSQHTLIKDNIILPVYHPISTVGLLILILDLLLFPPPLLPDLSSHLTYSLLFYLSYMEPVFYFFYFLFFIFLYIVHCNIVYFFLLETPSTRV